MTGVARRAMETGCKVDDGNGLGDDKNGMDGDMKIKDDCATKCHGDNESVDGESMRIPRITVILVRDMKPIMARTRPLLIVSRGERTMVARMAGANPW